MYWKKCCLILHHQKSLFIDNVYMCTFHRWKLRSGASCALVCVAAHLVCIQLTLLRMWSVWCLFLFCHGLMLTDHSLSLSHCPSLSLSLFFSISLSPSFSHSLFACYAALSRAESEAKPRRAGHLCKCAWIISSLFFLFPHLWVKPWSSSILPHLLTRIMVIWPVPSKPQLFHVFNWLLSSQSSSYRGKRIRSIQVSLVFISIFHRLLLQIK